MSQSREEKAVSDLRQIKDTIEESLGIVETAVRRTAPGTADAFMATLRGQVEALGDTTTEVSVLLLG